MEASCTLWDTPEEARKKRKILRGRDPAGSAVRQTSSAMKLDLLLGGHESCWENAYHWPVSQTEKAGGNSDSLAMAGKRRSANAVLVQGSCWPLQIRRDVVRASPPPAESCCLRKSWAGPAASSHRGRGGSGGAKARRESSALRCRAAGWLAPQKARRGLAAPRALQRGTLSSPPASSSWPPPFAALPARPKVPGGGCSGGRLPANTYTDSNDSRSLEEEGKRRTFLGKPLKNEHFCFPLQVAAGNERGVI